MRIYFTYLLLILGHVSFSQEQKPYYSQEFSVKNDNDAYLPITKNGQMTNKDGYYTEGIMISIYKVLPNHLNKTIAEYQLGQMIFTPQSLTYFRLHGIDRPYCGYLYVKYGRTNFYSENSMLQWDVKLGTIGDHSLAGQAQIQWHRTLHLTKFIGWENQIGNELNLNAHVAFNNNIWQPDNWFKVMMQEDGNLGNAFINAKVGAIVCGGLFEQNQNTELLNASIGTTATELKHQYELFVYWFPQYILQGYNATVQGGMFSKNPESDTKPLETFMYQQTFGLLYSKKRFSLRAEIVYQTKECTTQITPQRYGSLCFGYKIW